MMKLLVTALLFSRRVWRCTGNCGQRMRVLLCGLLLLWTTSCSRDGTVKVVLDNYVYRLSNVFAIDFDFAEFEQSVARYPKRSDLQLTLSTSSINLLDFLRLSQCDVQRHIGANNSSLGKLAPASQNLLYELEFVRLARQCLAEREQRGERTKLDDTLSDAVVLKVGERSLMQWNASFASVEFQQLFSYQSSMATASLTASPSELLAALSSISEFYRASQVEAKIVHSDDFEQSLAVIGSVNYMGQLQGVMLLFNNVLPELSERIRLAQQNRAICPTGNVSPRGKIMHNVFLRFYIGEVQPLLSQLVQRIEALRAEIAALRAAMPLTSPSAFDAYWQRVWSLAPSSEYGMLKHNIAEHTRMWQDNLSQCGLMPNT